MDPFRHEFTRRSVLTAALAALAIPRLVKKCECGHPRHEGLCPWCPAQRGCYAVSIYYRSCILDQEGYHGVEMSPVFLTKKGITVWR